MKEKIEARIIELREIMESCKQSILTATDVPTQTASANVYALVVSEIAFLEKLLQSEATFISIK